VFVTVLLLLGPMLSVPTVLLPTVKLPPTAHVQVGGAGGGGGGDGLTSPEPLTWALRGLRAVNSRAANEKIRGLMGRSSPKIMKNWWNMIIFYKNPLFKSI
jgi:hypothetical protein